MHPQHMIQLCDSALAQLDMLEGWLCTMPQAAKAVYAMLSATRELRHIAQFETTDRMTKEQIIHINNVFCEVARLTVKYRPANRY